MTRVAAGGALAVVLLIAAPALACTPKAGFTADPGRAQAGAAVHLTGNNFNADGMPVKIHWSAAESGTEQVLMSVPVDGSGSFQATATIPADARPGSYVLRAKQVGSAYEPARIQFQVLEPGEAPVPAEPGNTGTPSKPADPQRAPESPQPAPASQAADTTPVASSPAAPADAATAPRRAAATAAPATPAAAAPTAPVETADPAPAAPVQAVAEPAATPSVKSTTSDLWSGFNGRTAGQVPSLAAPVERAPAESMAGGIALLVVGTLTLLAGAGVAGIRRTRRVHG